MTLLLDVRELLVMTSSLSASSRRETILEAADLAVDRASADVVDVSMMITTLSGGGTAVFRRILFSTTVETESSSRGK